MRGMPSSSLLRFCLSLRASCVPLQRCGYCAQRYTHSHDVDHPSVESRPVSAEKPSAETPTDWVHRQMKMAVENGRCSAQGAEYFHKLVQDLPDLQGCLKEAKCLIGDNEPAQLTRYQQSQFSDRLSMYTSGVASEGMMQARREESAAKRFTQDGTPTGENYWMEAGSILSSPAVPSMIKDEVLKDLQKERKETSPAFLKPTAEQFPVLETDQEYAEHLRKQKRRLLDGGDRLF